MAGQQQYSSFTEALCYGTILVLTALSHFYTEFVPLHVNITTFSLCIIIAGANRSVYQLINEFRVVHGKKNGDQKQESGIETFTMDDAKAFPIYAGGTLVTLYALIKYFGKDVVNPIILTYMGIGNVGGMKAMLSSLTGGAVDFLEEKVIVHLKVDMIGLDLEVTVLDVIGLILSAISVLIYVFTKNWIYNNILAILFCVHAIQMIFLGNFKNGFALLTFLFFYDIFFVFGTDVMLTVAKNIDAPIKLLFPKNLTVDPPEFSLLGLGDIVIPGIFIAMCLRYDVLRALDVNKVKELVNGGKADEVTKLLQKQQEVASRPYFIGSIIGYLVAIITTVVIMFMFDHGQPALLYLVPGVLLSVVFNAWRLGEIDKVYEHSEETLTTKEPAETDGAPADSSKAAQVGSEKKEASD